MTGISRDSQDGLEWRYTIFSAVPHWTRQPSIPAIENVCRQRLNIIPGDLCRVSSYASGAFNKLYRVECIDQTLIMRVSLPVCPHYKTRGEVATLSWLRQNTTAPVPKVVASDASNNNEIGFEWILMELMPGYRAYHKWRTMSMEQKVTLTKRIAEIQVELFRYGRPDDAFRGIGTPYINAQGRDDISTSIAPGLLTSLEFFIGNRLKYEVSRGPFTCSYAWLESQLNLIVLEQTEIYDEAADDDDKEDAEEILGLARQLLSLLPQVFPSADEANTEPTVLWHDDLNLHNIIVSEQGEITAIVDWECVSALPMWITTETPKFLQGNTRVDEPKRDDYSKETPEPAASNEDHDSDHLDNEGIDSLYWIHRMDYEKTQLREVYETTLRELWYGWPLQDSFIKIDFYTAVLQCGSGLFLKQTERWIHQIQSGNVIRWADA
ncbi:kinase-like domain-containing protein [Nemania sp. FL0916]|nr:kinase-like domain-containing protein [Nemania sp. FL0916]